MQTGTHVTARPFLRHIRVADADDLSRQRINQISALRH